MRFADPVIPKPDSRAANAAAARQRTLVKPPGSLGTLEALAIWFAARRGPSSPSRLTPAISVFAADHGIAARGVSAYPGSVTAQMVATFAAGGAAINVLAGASGARLSVVDVGVATPAVAGRGLRLARVRDGTADFTRTSAMSRAEALAALEVGASQAAADVAAGADLLVAGDMGIGNTSAAAALLIALASIDPGEAVGAGTGLDEAAIARKRALVVEGIERASAQAPADALDWLAEVGGLEIAAIAGYYIEGARRGVPLLLDGFITTVAAIVATALAPGARDWMLAAHGSAERGHRHALAVLDLRPLVDLGMRLGEASGAALVLPIMQAAITLHAKMATFDEAGVAGGSPADG